MLDKIRTVFWAHKVLEIEGLSGVFDNGKKSEEKLTRSLEDRYKKLDPSFEYQDIFDAVMKSFFDKASWKKYLLGESIPKYSKEGELFTNPDADQKHPYTVNIVEALFPEIKGLFKNGPYGLISVLECTNTEDALEQYELSFKNLVKDTGYTKKTFYVKSNLEDIKNSEFHDYVLTWSDIKKEIMRDSNNYFDILNRFLPEIEIDQRWRKSNEHSLFLHLISAYVEARFFKKIPYIYSNIPGLDAGRLGLITIYDPQYGSESGILYLERQYGIDRKWWFDDNLLDVEPNVFELARRNRLEMDQGLFPEVDSFVFD